ncbi:MAG: low temperature requirement protein A [bacterium]|nr:low temperature requirement protein A [bacterium]
MTRHPLFTPPRHFRDVEFERHTKRAITWLELFYDLIYVATFIQIGNFLSDNLSWTGFFQFIVLMMVVWWAWAGVAFYQNRYFADDLTHRLIVFCQMFAIASLGLSVSKAFGDLYVQFTIAYVVTRLFLVLMYWRSMRSHPESKALSRGYIIGFSLGIAVWLGSLLLPADIHWVGWLVGITIELSVPLAPKMLKLQFETPVDLHHIAERFGIFTIIVLGEAFVKVLDDAQGSLITIQALLFSTVGLLVTYSLWWIYFADTAEAEISFENRSPAKAIAWIYGHLPLAIGLISFGVGAKKLFATSLKYPDEPLNIEYRFLYTVAILLYLLALALIDFGTQEADGTPHTQRAWIRLFSAGIVLAIGLIGTGLTATAYVTGIAVVMLTQVGISIFISWQDSLKPPVDHHH